MSGNATRGNVGGGGPSAKTILPAEAGSAGAARRFVRDVLANRNLEEALGERAALLTSELVTNAVLYAGSPVSVHVVIASPCVRVEVHDSSPQRPVRRRPRPDEGVPGHGLQLVEAMADDWGVLTDGEGKCVWIELRLPPQGGGAELGRVVLLGVPAAAYAALNLHLDELLHELEVAAAPGGRAEEAIDRLHGVLSSVLDDHREARASAWAQAQRAMGVPSARIDIELSLPPSAPDGFRELVELLEEVDRRSAVGELLTLPAPDDVRELRRWVAAEMWSQLRLGRDPRPCTLIVRNPIDRLARRRGSAGRSQTRTDEVATGRFDRHIENAEQARCFVAEELRKRFVGDETIFRAQLLATELVTQRGTRRDNPLKLVIAHEDGRIRLAAVDDGSVRPLAPSTEVASHRRGPTISEDLSEGWAVDAHYEDGKVVRYELPTF
jgi:anti-sigma regulatory factor (Ser/Thr protein kinase)